VIWWQFVEQSASLTPLETFLNRLPPGRASSERKRDEERDMPKRVSAMKEKNKPNKNGENGLPELNRNAAGIDVGNAEHYVAVPKGHDAQPVRKFGSSPQICFAWRNG
jgi:hypothetical protein